MGDMMTAIERFWQKVKIADPHKCWEWVAAKDTFGYGRMRWNGRVDGSNRISWEIHFGSIPKGFYILHKCDNPSCVNPAHLFLGTQKDNNIDRSIKGRGNHPKGEAHERAKLSESQVVHIKSLLVSMSAYEIARKFNVHPQTIYSIKHKRSWKYLLRQA